MCRFPGWRDRCARPRARVRPADDVGPDRHLGVPAGRCRRHRHAAGGRRAARRRDAADGVHRRDPVARERRARAVRHHARAQPHLADRRSALHSGRQSERAGAQHRRADRARQGRSRQALVRLVRRRLGLASLGRAVRADDRHRDAARAVSRHRARRHRSARRSDRPDVLARAGGDAAHRGRHVARDRHDGRGALGAVSGLSDHRRDRSGGLSVARLVRAVRAGRHAARRRREDKRGCRARAGLPEARQRLAEQGAEPAPNTPEAFTAFVNADVAKWLDLARKAGIKLAN